MKRRKNEETLGLRKKFSSTSLVIQTRYKDISYPKGIQSQIQVQKLISFFHGTSLNALVKKLEWNINEGWEEFTTKDSQWTQNRGEKIFFGKENQVLFKKCVFLKRKKKTKYEFLCLCFRFFRVYDIIPLFHT